MVVAPLRYAHALVWRFHPFFGVALFTVAWLAIVPLLQQTTSAKPARVILELARKADGIDRQLAAPANAEDHANGNGQQERSDVTLVVITAAQLAMNVDWKAVLNGAPSEITQAEHLARGYDRDKAGSGSDARRRLRAPDCGSRIRRTRSGDACTPRFLSDALNSARSATAVVKRSQIRSIACGTSRLAGAQDFELIVKLRARRARLQVTSCSKSFVNTLAKGAGWRHEPATRGRSRYPTPAFFAFLAATSRCE